jgi:hypothetical protein
LGQCRLAAVLVSNVSNHEASNGSHQKGGSKNDKGFQEVGIARFFRGIFGRKKDLGDDILRMQQ